jgi:HlyD family secretion protein
MSSFASLRRVGLLVAVAIAAGGGYWSYQAYLKRQSEAVARSLFVPNEKTHVYALGRLEPAGTIVQLAPKSGNEGTIVEELLVREGDDVAAGATLAVLDNHARRIAALKEAQSRRDASQARLEQVQAGSKQGDIEAQEAALKLVEEQIKVAQRDLRRAKELAEKKAISGELLDQRQWDVDRLEIERRRAAGMLVSLKEIRDVDVKVAQMDVSAAAAAVTRAQADAEASELKAPMDGRVLRIHTHPGERISDKGILELGNVRQMQAVAEVFEADVDLLRPGMVASIRIDASGNELSGRVTEIGQLVARKIVLTNDPVSDTDARVIEVRIDIDPDQIHRVERLANSRIEVRISLSGNAKTSNDRLEDSLKTARGE